MANPDSGFVCERAGGLLFYTVSRFARDGGVVAAFSTRQGGRSRGGYATLNLGLHVGDDPAAVLANRALFCASLGINPRHLVSCAQVHGTKVAVVGAADRGRGAFDDAQAVPEADGLATGTPGVPLIAFFADCVPLFLYDPVNRAIALVHAGWRGTLGRIGARAVTMLTETFGTSPAALSAAIGPSIGPCCYAVGPEVGTRFGAEFGEDGCLRRDSGGGWRLDLWAVNRRILLEAGVPAGNITEARRCTACAPEEFFSHRTSVGTTGRMAAIMMLE